MEVSKAKLKKNQRKQDTIFFKENYLLCQKATAERNPTFRLVPSFLLYSVNDQSNFTIRYAWAEDLNADIKKAIYHITEANMKGIYSTSQRGWRKVSKWSELTDDDARYLLVCDQDGNLVGFVHLRFVMEDLIPVVYCYEIQTLAACQGLGIGTRLMKILELLGMYARMKKVMLTVFKHNSVALSFYRKLNYEVDSFSPPEEEYEILSKSLCR